MSLISRFVHAESLRRGIAGCPLASAPIAHDESPCQGCPYNLAQPGRPLVGCSVSTTPERFEHGLASLKARVPDLGRDLESLLSAHTMLEGGSDDEAAVRLLKLAIAWYASIPEDGDRARRDEAELSMIIARFAKASIDLGEPVEILR
jgi:hypothetical protein